MDTDLSSILKDSFFPVFLNKMTSGLSEAHASSPIMDTIERTMNCYDRLSNVTVRSGNTMKRFDLPLDYDDESNGDNEDGTSIEKQPDKQSADEPSHEHPEVSDVNDSSDERSECSDHSSCDERGDGLGFGNNDDSDDGDEDDHDAGQLQILQFLREMNSELSSRLDKIDSKVSNIEGLTSKVPILEKRIDEAKQENAMLKNEISSMKTKYDALFERQLALETYNRKDNLVFHGVPYAKNENCADKVREVLKTHMKIDAKLVNNIRFHKCHRLPGKGDRGIICRFPDGDQRDTVWEKRFALKGSNIFIAENFPMEIENRRKKLYPIAKAARSQKMKAFVKYDKLLIDGTEYDLNNLSELPKGLRLPPSTMTKDGITCFFTSDSPLSNFRVVEEGISIDGVQYDSVERYFQMKKAEFAEQPRAISQIEHAKTAAQCKGIGDSLVVDIDRWLPAAKDAMYKACLAKFTQHSSLKKFLLDTGNTILAEAGPNKVWGIGLHIDNPDAFVQNNWQGQNNLGLIMMDVRKKLRAQDPSPVKKRFSEPSRSIRL